MLRTTRLVLEPLEPAHADELFDGLADLRLYEFIDDDRPDSVEALRERYEGLAVGRSPDGEEVWLNWAVREISENRYVGFVQTTIHGHRSATIAYLLFRDEWGRGYGREAVSAMLGHVRDVHKIANFRACIHPQNLRSAALLEALGFERLERIEHTQSDKADAGDVEFVLTAR